MRLANVTVSHTRSAGLGGAIAAYDSVVEVQGVGCTDTVLRATQLNALFEIMNRGGCMAAFSSLLFGRGLTATSGHAPKAAALYLEGTPPSPLPASSAQLPNLPASGHSELVGVTVHDARAATTCGALMLAKGGKATIVDLATTDTVAGYESGIEGEVNEGGAVCVVEASQLVLRGASLRRARAMRGGCGGAVLCHGAASTLRIEEGGLIEDSTSQHAGGGIAVVDGCQLTVVNSVISNATSASGFGGGVYVSGGSTASLINTTVRHSAAATSGAGLAVVANVSLVLVAETTTVLGTRTLYDAYKDTAGCRAYAVGFLGHQPAIVSVTGGALYGNTAQVAGGGAAVLEPGAALGMAGTRLERNWAREGGAVAVRGGKVELEAGTRVQWNGAEAGGGVHVRIGSRLIVADGVSVANNSALDGLAGGVFGAVGASVVVSPGALIAHNCGGEVLTNQHGECVALRKCCCCAVVMFTCCGNCVVLWEPCNR